MSNFVLTTGAWHGAWCYKELVRKLRNLGHEVYAHTYSGLGDRRHLINGSINLSTHIEEVANLIEFEDLSNVILVGHSYGGLVITGVADKINSRISTLVYIDAFLPENGQSQFDLMPPEYCQAFLNLTTQGFSVSPLPAESFNFLKKEDCEKVKNKLTPHPLATFTEKISLTGKYKEITKLYYLLSENWGRGPFGDLYDKLAKTDNWTVNSFPCGHDIMIDLPEKLSYFLTTIK